MIFEYWIVRCVRKCLKVDNWCQSLSENLSPIEGWVGTLQMIQYPNRESLTHKREMKDGTWLAQVSARGRGNNLIINLIGGDKCSLRLGYMGSQSASNFYSFNKWLALIIRSFTKTTIYFHLSFFFQLLFLQSSPFNSSYNHTLEDILLYNNLYISYYIILTFI